jgi:hypothetical protein
VISSPIYPLRLSARSDLRYLFVLATVHYDVLSDGQYRLDVSEAVAVVGGFDSLELERARGLVRRRRLAMLFGVTSKGGHLTIPVNLGARLLRSHLLRPRRCELHRCALSGCGLTPPACACGSAPFVSIHTLLELGAQYTFMTTVCTQEKCFEARPFAREDIWSFECIHSYNPLKARGGTLDATPTPTLQGTLPHQISSQAPSWN